MAPSAPDDGSSPRPLHRPRRLRIDPRLRRAVAETALSLDDLIQGVFVVPGHGVRRPVPSMPGIDQMSVDVLVDHARQLEDLGLVSILLFGVPEHKDEQATGAFGPDAIVQRAMAALRQANTGLYLIADACFCEYTSHGHCGVLSRDAHEVVDNDATLVWLGRLAVELADAGAHMIAPSGMMDGTVRAVRRALDDAGHPNTPIMMYSAKFASGFYGPFRDAAESAPQFGDRTSYQMDVPNAREALREVALDEAEGADIVMVKPALAYLDIIHQVRQSTRLPVAAYNVSGEYAMVKAAGANGWLDPERIALEILTAIKRAGADLIITYHGPDVAERLR